MSKLSYPLTNFFVISAVFCYLSTFYCVHELVSFAFVTKLTTLWKIFPLHPQSASLSLSLNLLPTFSLPHPAETTDLYLRFDLIVLTLNSMSLGFFGPEIQQKHWHVFKTDKVALNNFVE